MYREEGSRVPNHDIIRETAILGLLEELGISDDHLTLVKQFNPSAALPFHGFQHLVTVALNAGAAALHERLPDDQVRAAVIAGLWHDFDHQGDPDDRVNIGAAISGYRNLSPDVVDPLVVAAIEATLFPHTPPASTLAAVMQDADALQTLEPDGARFMVALERELGVLALPPAEFLAAVPLHTTWAKEKAAGVLGR
ncbi:HD domain-containing protein [Agromyces sp. NPDC057679]|uniref:HD domain-containing protein n=1 Tax=Agromyces sp. NPDC057679 TaxID=3346207 RepID=UPI00366CC040